MNWERIGLLLHIEEGTRAHPGLKNIHDKAMEELIARNNESEPMRKEEPTQDFFPKPERKV